MKRFIIRVQCSSSTRLVLFSTSSSVNPYLVPLYEFTGSPAYCSNTPKTPITAPRNHGSTAARRSHRRPISPSGLKREKTSSSRRTNGAFYTRTQFNSSFSVELVWLRRADDKPSLLDLLTTSLQCLWTGRAGHSQSNTALAI